MLVVLHIESGPRRGHKTWLKGNGVVRIGRTRYADFAIDSDPYLGDIHFAIQSRQRMCFVHDLESASGTFVNDQQISKQLLSPGDVIQAGTTRFRVEMDGSLLNGQPREQISSPAVTQHLPDDYRVEPTKSDLPHYVQAGNKPGVADVAMQLAEIAPMYLLAWFDPVKFPNPPQLTHSTDFVPLPAHVSWQRYCGMLVAADEVVDIFELLTQGWKAQSVVALFSQAGKRQLVEHARRQVGSFSGVDVLREQLFNCPRGFAEQIVGESYTIMLPDDITGAWHLWANPHQAASWQQLGFSSPPKNLAEVEQSAKLVTDGTRKSDRETLIDSGETMVDDASPTRRTQQPSRSGAI